jgi:pimeloyl-ACP methyl ester carboxylesterase
VKQQRHQIFLVILALGFSILCYGQIDYGSNNGNYLTIRGTKIYYEEYGEGTPLLLLHGGFGDISDFSTVIPEFSKTFRVIIPDAPGHGRSEFPDKPLSYQIMAEYYSEMIDQLELDSVYVIGWSDGGNSGLILAHNRPDKVKKLLVSGANYKSEAYIGMEGFKETILNVEWVESNWQDWINYYSKKSPDGDWKRYIEEGRKMWLADEYFSKSILEKIIIPVLVVYGDNDSVILEHGLEISNAIKNSQLCILPNTSHNVFGVKTELILIIAEDFFSGK